MDQNQPVPEDVELSFESDGPTGQAGEDDPSQEWAGDQKTGGVPGALGKPDGPEAGRNVRPGDEVTDESGLIPPQTGERKAA